MTDTIPTMTLSRSSRAPRLEYRLYYALVFTLVTPGAVGGRALDLLRGVPGRGVAARARAHAGTITPLIFSA